MDKNTTTGKCLSLNNCVNNRNLLLYHLNIGEMSKDDIMNVLRDHEEKFKTLTKNVDNLQQENNQLKNHLYSMCLIQKMNKTTTGKCHLLNNCVNNRNLLLYHLNIETISIQGVIVRNHNNN